MQWSDVRKTPSRQTLQEFSVLCVVFAVVIVSRRLYEEGFIDNVDRVVAGAGVLIGVVGLARPTWIRWPFGAAMIVTFPIGWTAMKLMLVAMFYLVMTPIALLFRLMGRDELRLRPDSRNDVQSYWIERRRLPRPRDYFRQF